MTSDFSITPAAIHRLQEIYGQSPNGVRLRISVSAGGCAGFQYVFTFDDDMTDDDHIFGDQQAQVVIDEISLDLLKGSCLDFEETLMGASLVVKNNPNAVSGCGCGTSFSPI
jgi:iron-sulfur cluster insertion protein